MQQYQIIKEASLEKVRDADIYEVISHYAQLKKSGSSWTCNSPLTNEKTPSFHVNPVKNNWVCYSSNQGGDGLKFVMIKDSLSFIEAVEKIASICNILLEYEEVSEEQKGKIDRRKRAIDILNSTAKKYQDELNNLPDTHWAKTMIKDRGFTQDSIRDFSIGYTPGNRVITAPLIDQGHFELGKTTGLISVKEDRNYDFFNDRVMFPIHNEKGEVVSFGGRADKDILPKYLNGKETPFYNKTKILYGLWQARQTISRTGIAVLTEGYTDVIAAHQSGVCNTIASCGTALTSEQVLLLKRYGNTIIIMRDNDYPKTVKSLIDLTVSIATDKLIEFSDKFTSINDQNCVEIARIVIKKLGDSEDNKILIEQLDDKIRSINPRDLGPGTSAAFKDIDLCLKYGLKVLVCLLPIGEDPDSLSRKADLKKYIDDNKQDAFEWKINKLRNIASDDPDEISIAVDDISLILHSIGDDIKRNIYVEKVAKAFKVAKATINEKVKAIQEDLEFKASSSIGEDKELQDELKLPKGSDMDEYKRYGFVTVNDCYYFPGRSGGFFRGSNFKLEPLFHIYGQQNNKRICEATYENGRRKLIVFESTDFVQRARFETKLIDEGGLVFNENVSNNHFIIMRNRILSSFTKAFEITTLGWQPKERIFAFANYIYDKGQLKKVNPYGIVEINKDEYTDEDKGEYFEDVNSYFLPAFSAIYRNVREGDDPYENDRFFVYKQSPVTIQKWVEQMVKVYGYDKATVGISFNIAAMFRDLILKRYQFFPHMFCAGEKGSGKSKFAESCVAMFTYKQEPFDLNSGTLVAFFRRLARICNIPIMLEEYHDNIEPQKFQALKGGYDGRGREMGKATGDNKTTTTKVLSALIILSQYLSSRDDNSLTSRSVLLNFLKPTDPFTTDAVEEYTKLKSWEEHGLSSMLIDILDVRPYVEENLYKRYSEYQSKFKKDLKGKEYQERMLQNYVALITPISLVMDKIYLGLNINDIYSQYLTAILDSSDLIIESEGLAEYWRVIEYLLDTKRINERIHFNVLTEKEVKLYTRKGEADIVWKNDSHKKLLFLNQKALYQMYHKEVSTREGAEIITDATIRNYFKSKKYFIGIKNSHRFGEVSTTALVFDYEMMQYGGVLNLDRERSTNDPFNNNTNSYGASETGIG
ncbi:DNA primase [Myroides odoratimimus CCUG 3837]|uniref:DNA primase n=1 Tax=Myroides odoratimimus TaxID=76832 RepID=UPI000280ACF8|nr:DNA primase [Myroides odoratimimus]EKB02368.1 DNA primase [Myroides odoratimimus CCUG 3837]